MRGKKTLFLALALLFPVCIFLFLKFFGRNEFDVPLLHQEGITSNAECNLKYPTPYLLPDSVMQQIERGGKASLYIMNFSLTEPVSTRVSEEVSSDEARVIQPASISRDAAQLRFLKDCVFLLKAPADVVLVDNLKRIRGYYQAQDRYEMDRLLVEINIILKKY